MVTNLRKNKEKRLKKTYVIQINGLPTSRTQEIHHKTIHIYTLHFIHDIHINTRTCHIHHKRGVTEVCHFACEKLMAQLTIAHVHFSLDIMS